MEHMCLLVQLYSANLCTRKVEESKCQLRQIKGYIYVLCIYFILNIYTLLIHNIYNQNIYLGHIDKLVYPRPKAQNLKGTIPLILKPETHYPCFYSTYHIIISL